VDVRNGQKTFGSARAQCFTSYEFASSSTRRPVTRNLITTIGLNLKVQYFCYERFHNTQS